MKDRKKNGTVNVWWTPHDPVTDQPEIVLRWTERDYDDNVLNVIWLSKTDCQNLIRKLENAVNEMDDWRERVDRKMAETSFTSLYAEFERKYNPYPVQMSRSEAFRRALKDGLIDGDTYEAAHEYYRRLWNYVGD